MKTVDTLDREFRAATYVVCHLADIGAPEPKREAARANCARILVEIRKLSKNYDRGYN